MFETKIKEAVIMRFSYVVGLLFICILTVGLTNASAQSNISGTVRDGQTGETLPGVNILVKGASQGTTTNADGYYSLSVENLQDTLRFSYIGYAVQEIPINNRTKIDVNLATTTFAVDELVVVGYGTQQQENLTGSVSSVSSEDIEGISAGNSSKLLQGKMAGVNVSGFDNQPGRNNAQIRIRGTGSFNSGQNPLVVIDGITTTVDEFGQLSPSDIKDVTVLKDAASAAIYGARAANGVILVQTKQGGKEGVEFNIRSSLTRQTHLTKLELLDSPGYARITNEWLMEQGSDPVYTDEQIQMMESGSNPDLFANTDWFNEVIDPALMQNYYLSASGGSETTQFLISSEFKNQDGIMMGTGSKKINVRAKVNTSLNDKISFGVNIFGYRQRINEPATVSANNSVDGGGGNSGDQAVAYRLRRFSKPTIPVRYSNGDWGSVDGAYPNFGGGSNLVKNIQMGDQYGENYHINAKLYGNIIIGPVEFQSNVAGIYDSNALSTFSPTDESYDSNGNIIGVDPTNSLVNNNNTSYNVSNTNTATYKKQFGRHNINLLAGQSIEFFRQDYFYAYAEGFPNNNIQELGAGSENKNVDGYANDYGLYSFFSRATYSYRDRYLLEGNLRYDGSSRLPEDNRFALFPSVSAGWILSEENFMDDVSWLSFFKLRASWGKLGNQEIGYYPYAQTFAADQGYLIGGDVAPGAAVTDLANQRIRWETTTSSNIGLNLNLLNDKIQITADYFDKKTTDLLLRLPIPASQGNVQAPFQNVGELKNTGFELSINYNQVFDSGLNFNVGINGTTLKNEIVDLGKLGEGEVAGFINGKNISVEGHPIGAYYGYVAQGFFQSQEEIDNHATQFGNLRPGDVKFKDLNGDGTIDADNDRTIIGDPFPDLTFGLNLTAHYKGFDATTFIQGVSGIDRINFYNNQFVNQTNYSESIKDHWSESNRDAQWFRLGNTANNSEHSTYWMRDASYVRLKHLEFGYTLPLGLTQKISLKNARIYLAGYNLFTLTPMEEGFDPERGLNNQSNSNYPALKNYTLGINIKF